MENIYTLLWCFSALCLNANGLPKSLLFVHENAIFLPKGDDISVEYKLNVPLVYYGVSYKTIYINSNGVLSFQTEIPHFFNFEFPLDYPVIAPLYSNIDTTNSGTISYYETENEVILERATSDVQETFTEAFEFEASSAFIVTWSDVGYHKHGSDKVNTFQVAIITDGLDTYVEFLYPDNGIEWIQGTGDGSGLPDARAQAGFVSPDGRYHVLPGSGTDRVRNLDKWSNMNLPGQWIFRVGLLDDIKNIESPDINNSDYLENIAPARCSEASTQCHSQAKCVDYDDGFCCKCKDKYYGNGKYCIIKDVPLRVNGKVNGEINGQKLDNLDLQSYVVMQDARTYTAISKIPKEIGFSVQSLQILASTIGWVFAKPIGETQNGFQLTGGVFNHTAVITYETEHTLTIRQKYLGLDVFDRLSMEVQIEGSIPTLPETNATITEYQEEYTLTGPGVVQSSSSRVLKYNGSSNDILELTYGIKQHFVFDYCKYNATEGGLTWKLKVGKNFISYESREQIIRFGLSNKIGPLDDIDPCEEGRATCTQNSACVVENDSFRCICNPGYHEIFRDNEYYCADINECQQGIHECDFNAQCVNQVGTYGCTCNAGFEGDGKICTQAASCASVKCPENSECVQTTAAACQCMKGFAGNGQVCVPLTSQSCHLANNCSPVGYCAISPQTGQYSCYCMTGYIGDGYQCQEDNRTEEEIKGEEVESSTVVDTTTLQPVTESKKQDGAYTTEIYGEEETIAESPVPEAQCILSVCFCPAGFKFNPNGTCSHKSDGALATMGLSGTNYSCDVINNCDVNAQCLFSTTGKYYCVCNPGFKGDGFECRELEESCFVLDMCDIHATCKEDDSTGNGICMCNSGYQGDGLSCQPIANCITNSDCQENEECLYTALTLGYECVCKEGMVKDSQNHCVVLSGTCGGGKCVENAECLYDTDYQTYYCSCKSDYMGDGITECKTRPVGCNVINNCGLNAHCQYDTSQSVYQCKCTEGFFGDGFLCYAEKNCNIDPYLCSPHARCIANASRRFVCECNPGYTGNGTVCKEVPKHVGNFLLLNQGMATFKIPFEPTRKRITRPIQMKANQVAVGLDVDCFGGRIYWSDIFDKAIRSSTYNGTDQQTFINQDIGSPEGISIDWVSRNIYWTDSTKDTIEVANIETKLRRTLFKTDLMNPRGIAVHPQRGKIFWSDWNRKNPKIEWANSDGTGRELFLHGETVKLPNSLTIDFDRDQLCYADAGTQKVECVDIDTKTRYVIATNCTYPFGVAVNRDKYYWSDWITRKIEVVEKESLKRLKSLTIPLGGGANKLYEVVAVGEQCPNLLNVCHYYKDQCPAGYICLPDGKGSRRCSCGTKIDSPNETSTCNDI